MLYYHDKPNQTVISAPDTPTVSKRKNKRAELEGWTVSAELSITRADNCINPATHQWKFNLKEYIRDWYTSGDSREAAIGHFMNAKYPNLPQIRADEYQCLQAQYERIANNNKPPMAQQRLDE